MQKTAKSIVAIRRCTEYKESAIADAIGGQFKLLGGLERFIKRGDKVLLKPNFIAPKPRHCATQTDPAIVIETAKLLKDFGARPFVADSPAWGNIRNCAKAIDIEVSLKKLDVPIRQLNRPIQCEIAGVKVGVSSVALEADAIINLPKLKAHQQLVATIAVKNMFGCVSGKWKAYWHYAKGGSEKRFCKFLIEIYKRLNPVLTIVDGVIAMEGPGPINGRPRPLGYLAGSTDPIACEMICGRLINLAPDQIPIVRAARQIGFGCFSPDDIKIVGDDFPETVCTDFAIPALIPIRFSLPYVCKSVCKQIILLIKSLARK